MQANNKKLLIMEYPIEFESLINRGDYENEIIGIGNPSSCILFVGKEPAIPKEREQQRKLEIEENYTQWKTNVDHNVGIDDVLPQSDVNYKYNPLFPHRGQKYKIRIEEFVDGEVRVKRGKEGTSKTWYQYQKIWDLIRFGKENVHSGIIDFHEHCFSTELSSANAKYSSQAEKDKRRQSIDKRKDILRHPFYLKFPIVILAVGHYPKEHNIDIESIFQTKWNQQTCVVGRFWYNIHSSTTNNPKILIHTNQLSMVSNDLIKEIAERCIDFKNKYGIRL